MRSDCVFPELDHFTFLTGCSGPLTRPLNRPDLGLLVQPGNSTHLDIPHYTWYGADNGCFGQGEKFCPTKWLRWLERLPVQNCLFAVLPDVVGDAAATLERSVPFVDTVQNLGFPVALVGQDGLEQLDIPWELFDCLFIGGSDQWKLSTEARELSAEAKRRGKWIHMGRVNSFKRLQVARAHWADSADGTFLGFGPSKNLPQLLRWLDTFEQQAPAWTGGISIPASASRYGHDSLEAA